MRKLIFTLCLLAAATGAFGQTSEAEEYRQATAAVVAEQNVLNARLSEFYEEYKKVTSSFTPGIKLNDEQRAWLEAANAKLDSLKNMSDVLEYREYEAMLAALERREPPFSALFLRELGNLTSVSYTRSNYRENTIEGYDGLLERAAKVWERLSDEQKASSTGQEMKLQLFPLPAATTGDPVPDAELYDLDGNVHRLSDYAGKGKYLLIDFWEVGCGPCIKAMPELKKIYEANEDIFTVIGINTNDPNVHEVWAKISEEQGITWPNLNSPHGRYSELANRFRLVAWPLQVVVSPEGVILGRITGVKLINGKPQVLEELQVFIPELK